MTRAHAATRSTTRARASTPTTTRARRAPLAAVGLCALALWGCASVATHAGAGPLRPLSLRDFRGVVDSMVTGPGFRNASWGVLIVDAVAGDTLYSRNAGKLFMPASNEKLLTGSTALAQLGPDFRFTTRFAATGEVADSVLHGDLVVYGTGDPTFSDTLQGGDFRGAFRAMADSIVAHGIRRIDGALVRGGPAFTDDDCGFGWELADMNEPYGACVNELFVNEGYTRVPRAAAYGEPPAMQAVAIRDPRAAFFAALRDAMVERGVTLGGGVDTARVVPDSGVVTLFQLESVPLPAILARMLKPSQNQIAELLFKTLGRVRGGAGTADSARGVVARQLVAWGADTAGFVIRDGSGMSRHDYASPETIVRVLDAMRRGPHAAIWYNALAIGGVDGTIEDRMAGTAAAGNVHAKTGSLDRVRSLSGYVTSADGRQIIFSFLCNNFTVPTRAVAEVQDSVLALLAARSRPRR